MSRELVLSHQRCGRRRGGHRARLRRVDPVDEPLHETEDAAKGGDEQGAESDGRRVDHLRAASAASILCCAPRRHGVILLAWI